MNVPNFFQRSYIVKKKSEIHILKNIMWGELIMNWELLKVRVKN